MITVTLRPDAVWVYGHSGYAPKGQDIVCAAVSILIEATAAALREKGELVLYRCGDGFCTLLAEKDSEAMRTLRQGLLLLAKDYGAYVRVKDFWTRRVKYGGAGEQNG